MTAIFRPTSTYYHSCDGIASTCERLTTPLHYHLHRGDIVAFRKELRNGASALATDRLGRTPLCVLVQKLEDLFMAGLCTSLPVDDLVQTFRTEALFPAKFAIHSHQDVMENLYALQQDKLYRAEANGGRVPCPQHPDGRLRRVYPEVPQHPLCHCGLPSHAFDEAPEPVADPHALKEKYFQQTMLVAVEDAINKPMSQKIQLRLQRMAREIKAYVDLLHELISCDLLVNHTLERRRDLWRTEHGETGPTSKECLWLREFTIPYLYTVCLRILFELYPLSPDGAKWNPKAPSDARCLVGIVCKLELPGFQVLLFMADVCQLLCAFLCSLPAPHFFPPRPVFQYLAHMAFVLDCPSFWQVITTTDRDACLENSPFDWNGTLAELKAICGDNMEAFISSLERRPMKAIPVKEPRRERTESTAEGGATEGNFGQWPVSTTTQVMPASYAATSYAPSARAAPDGSVAVEAVSSPGTSWPAITQEMPHFR